jgi:putative copper resistance protein D
VIAVLADAGLPPLGGSQLFATQFDFVPVAMIVIALALYLWGVRRNNALHPRHPWSVGKTIAWIGALFTTGVAIFSFVGVYDGELFWDHMLQHLILIMVAAPLFAIASPLRLVFCATSGTAHLVVTEALRSRVAKFLGNPFVAFILYAVVIPISHLTVWYNYTLTQENVHNAEHLTFLLVGYLFWRQIFGNDPNAHRLHPALQFFYLFMAIPIDTFTGLSLAGASHELFPAYFATHRTWGPSYVTDLHVGGDIMWVVGDTLMLWPMIPVALRWMHMDERSAVRVDRELDELALREAAEAGPVPDHPPRSISSTRPPSGSVQSRNSRAVPPRSMVVWLDSTIAPPSSTTRAAVPATSRTRKDRWVNPSWLTARRSRGPKGAGSLKARSSMAVWPLRMNWEVTSTSGNSMSWANSEPMAWDSAFSKPRASQ